MKFISKVALIISIIVLAGCGESSKITEKSSVDEIIEVAEKAAEAVGTCQMDIGFEMKLKVDGEMQSVKMTRQIMFDKNKQIFMLTDENKIINKEGKQIAYGQVVEDGCRVYVSNDNGKKWVNQTVEQTYFAQLWAANQPIEILLSLENIEVVGEETIDGVDTVKIKGRITEETSGIFGYLQIFQEMIYLGKDEALMAYQETPIEFYIDKNTGEIIKMNLDLKQVISIAIEKGLIEENLATEFMEVEIATYHHTVNQINQIEEIKIPEEALQSNN